MIIEFKNNKNICKYKDLNRGDLFAFYADYCNNKKECGIYMIVGKDGNNFAVDLQYGSTSSDYSPIAEVIRLDGTLTVEEK